MEMIGSVIIVALIQLAFIALSARMAYNRGRSAIVWGLAGYFFAFWPALILLFLGPRMELTSMGVIEHSRYDSPYTQSYGNNRAPAYPYSRHEPMR